MKAAIYTRYGPPDVIRITEVDQPVPKDNEVLIRFVRPRSTHWTGISSAARRAWVASSSRSASRGTPRLGVDVAGQVEAAGKSVTRFKPGDAVYGACKGACAEYACASESKLAAKPDCISFQRAAGVPVAALTALQGLRDHGRLQPGQAVLINGAAGGVGTPGGPGRPE